MRSRVNEGGEITLRPREGVAGEPGHDAWTVGDEPCILLDTGLAAYAKPV